MTDLVVPPLGESVSEATVAAWLHKVGETVPVDEALVELETDKATVEVCAPHACVIAEILVPEGDTVEMGSVIAKLTPAEASAAVAPPPGPAPAPEQSLASPEPKAAVGLDPARAPRSGPGGTITADDLRTFLGAGEPGREGPAARKLLAERGLSAADVRATGPSGRVTKGDVLAHVAAPPSEAAAPAPSAGAAASREERVRMPRIRQTIARRLKEAQNTAAILTTFNEVDMGAVIELRRRFREEFEKKHGVRLGFTSFFAKAVVAALQEIPAVNAEIDGDEIVYKHYVSIGMAVSAPNGLVVPVIRDCQARSFADIERALGELAAKARDGALREDDMAGGTFTISNGGVFGSLLSTPILNRPQSGILGLHKIEERPVARDGEVVIRPMMYVALSYDHRIIDGREAVTFLVKVKECIEDPQRLMLEV
ncbi:MAG: 2-oxoglutarate dehydrogenase complex dihydrolipoyllysine-residue succinyltransferase [Myxococcota bacterium]